MKYWKALLKYGHVGVRKEVSINRHLSFEDDVDIFGVIDFISEMPGVKKNLRNKYRVMKPILQVGEITYEEYEEGLKKEDDNIYLKQSKDMNNDEFTS